MLPAGRARLLRESVPILVIQKKEGTLMRKRNGIKALVAGAVLLTGALWGQEGCYPPAPGQEKLPVVFWAHYMSVVFTASLGGGVDYSFVTAAGSNTDQYERHINEAIKSGLNGFQLLAFADAAAYEAARRVKEKTGVQFYLNPQWADFGEKPETAVERMSGFYKAHKDDPHVFCIDGKQVHFFYNQGSWSGGKRWTDSANVPLVKEKLKERGIELMLVPSSGHTPIENIITDREEIGHGTWPAFAGQQAGSPGWLEKTAWDGLDGFNHYTTPAGVADLVVQRLKSISRPFLYVPAVSMGYDSSNRPTQAIHCPQNGVRTLRDELRTWVERGFRQVVAITWNDSSEAPMYPSSRSPYGFADVLQYYRGLAEKGESPFEQPHFVVAYDSETLLGDELMLQVLALPERKAIDSDYIAQIRLEDENGTEVSQQTLRLHTTGERNDVLGEARVDTTHWAGQHAVLSPVVSIVRINSGSSERRVEMTPRRLAPIHLRYNQLRFYTPYVISLNHVDPQTKIDLQLANAQAEKGPARFPTGDKLPLLCRVKSPQPLRKLMLAESRISCGTFREDDTTAAVGAGKVRRYLRLRATQNGSVTFTVPGGQIDELYAVFWKSEELVKKGSGDSISTRLLPHAPQLGYPGLSDGWPYPVIRFTAEPNATIKIRVTEPVQTEFTTTIDALNAGPVIFTAPVAVKNEAAGKDASGKDTTFALRAELAVAAQEASFDYPLPATGEYLRSLPLCANNEPDLAFHVWSLSNDGLVAYSRPLRILRLPSGEQEAVIKDIATPVTVPYIQTRGTFDDFVDVSSSSSRNYFTASDVVTADIPAYSVPYFLYNCDEGVGEALNDGGQIQLGNGWLKGSYHWLTEGWRGKAVQLTGGKIALRSKTFPHGAYTFSVRLRLDPPAPAQAQTVISDGDHWLGLQTQGVWLQVQSDGRIMARRSVRDVRTEVTSVQPLNAGWNHIAIVSDLLNFRLYINGKPEGESPLPAPAYQRTHSVPELGFDKTLPRGETSPAFNGALDQIEIIGAPLDARQIEELFRIGQWRAR